ncbi:NAD(P)-dependent glycerol-3-phosphate dehydrogenase [SAR202 cluster bacterium AC-409-J13_OGT_754m]|nr:NAD(P)-dependent glycerol-3-phosphate dehydrogenase [SAR202 cluster bacterium AC-409-J13_OGT_754m]
MQQVAVIGTTTWGTTLAIHLGRKNVSCTLIARTREESEKLESDRENTRFLKNQGFPDKLQISDTNPKTIQNAEIILIAVPSQRFRENIRLIKKDILDHHIVLIATKGLEMDTGKRMSEIINEELPSNIAQLTCVLSGPNLAMEIISGKPSSTVIASSDQLAALKTQTLLNSPSFRVYTNKDIVGVELGGALKNIIAIGSGIVDGLEYGANTKASFITRGLAEITRLGIAAGANPLTFSGLAGLGDLLATTSSPLSRNRFVGLELAKGNHPKTILSRMSNVAEGVYTTAATLKIAEQLQVEMPITKAIYKILFENMDLNQAIRELMDRPTGSE